jgi:hypothetical protein
MELSQFTDAGKLLEPDAIKHFEGLPGTTVVAAGYCDPSKQWAESRHGRLWIDGNMLPLELEVSTAHESHPCVYFVGMFGGKRMLVLKPKDTSPSYSGKRLLFGDELSPEGLNVEVEVSFSFDSNPLLDKCLVLDGLPVFTAFVDYSVHLLVGSCILHGNTVIPHPGHDGNRLSKVSKLETLWGKLVYQYDSITSQTQVEDPFWGASHLSNVRRRILVVGSEFVVLRENFVNHGEEDLARCWITSEGTLEALQWIDGAPRHVQVHQDGTTTLLDTFLPEGHRLISFSKARDGIPSTYFTVDAQGQCFVSNVLGTEKVELDVPLNEVWFSTGCKEGPFMVGGRPLFTVLHKGDGNNKEIKRMLLPS